MELCLQQVDWLTIPGSFESLNVIEMILLHVCVHQKFTTPSWLEKKHLTDINYT